MKEIPAYVLDPGVGTFPEVSHVLGFLQNLSQGGQLKWGMSFRRGKLHDYYSGQDFNLAPGHKLILSDVPIAACFRFTKPDYARNSQGCEVALCSLMDGATELKTLLFKLPYKSKYKNKPVKTSTVFDAGDQVLYLRDEKIAFMKIPRELAKQFKKPPTVEPFEPFISSVGQKISRKIRVNDLGSDFVAFELEKPVVGAQVDRKTGQVMIDSQEMWKRYVDSFVVQKTKDPKGKEQINVMGSSKRRTLETIVESYLELGQNLPSGMIPYQDSFVVKLVNVNGRTVHKVRVEVILVGPRQAFVDKIAEALASPEADGRFGGKGGFKKRIKGK